MSSTALLNDKGSYVYESSSHKHPSSNGSVIVRLLVSQTSCVAIKNLGRETREWAVFATLAIYRRHWPIYSVPAP